MNNFTKHWLTATVAPESIVNIKTVNSNYLDCVRNEDNSKQVVVLSNDNIVIAIGNDYDDLLKSPNYTFKDSLSKIATMLELNHYSN